MSSKRNLVLGTAVIVLCAGVAAMALNGATATKVKFADLPSRGNQFCEVYGKLDAKSIRPIRGANTVRFTLVEEKTNDRLDVLYDNPSIALPVNFPTASHAIVKGTYDPTERRFQADTVSTKCPSKYDNGPMEIDRQKATEQFQREAGLKVETN